MPSTDTKFNKIYVQLELRRFYEQFILILVIETHNNSHLFGVSYLPTSLYAARCRHVRMKDGEAENIIIL